LIGEHRRLQTRNLGDGSFRLRFRDCRLSELERDARQEKMCEHGFSGEQRLIENPAAPAQSLRASK